MTMTSRERVERAIRFEKPDRAPYNFWMDRRRMAELESTFGPEFRVTHFGVDVIESYGCVPAFPTGEFKAQAGTHWMVKELFEDWRDAASIPMPPLDYTVLFAGLEAHLEQFPDHAVIVNSPNVLTLIEAMRKQEQVYVDMMLYPDAVQAFFHRISDIMAVVAERACTYDITALYVQDDVAYNNGLFISPDLLREYILPHWKKVIDIGHAHNVPIFFHTDGKVDTLWPLFRDELGVRMLNPLQPELHDFDAFKRTNHGEMGVYGGLATNRIHEMTPEEVGAHVQHVFAQLGADGGLILSSHDIDYAVSVEQLTALSRAVAACVY